MLCKAVGQTFDHGKPLNAVKVSMLNGHDTGIGKDLLREVVDQLAVDKAVEAVADDILDLGSHLLLFCLLYVCHLKIAFAWVRQG